MRSCRRPLIVLAGLALIVSACSADDADSAGNTTIAAAATNEAADGADLSGATRPLSLTDPASTPSVDRSKAEVPLEEIIFDTFDGGSVPLSEADDATIERLFDAIAPIDGPDYETVARADWLTRDDLVVGFVDPGGGAWAYPVRILNSREIVNDELGGLPLVITYCPLCGSGVVYDRRLGDRSLSFSNTSALLENDMVMVDRETGTYWWQVAGTGVVGDLVGSTLELLPSQTTSWASWTDQFPETLVMVRPAGRSYSGDSFATYGQLLDSGRTPFPVSEGVLDDGRLAPSARVVVVTVDGETKAWPTEPSRVVDDTVGGTSVIVTLDGTGGAITDAAGIPVPSRSAFWFSVVSAYPDVELGS